MTSQRVNTILSHLEDDDDNERIQISVDSENWENRSLVQVLDTRTNQVLVQVKVNVNRNPSFVPSGYMQKIFSSSKISGKKSLSVLKFLMQKDLLGQDTFLLAPPGAQKRRLAMAYCELVGREVEFLSISQDTTVADIKQRREILSGTARFEDSCAVRAAIHGRVLILEGVEKAERNVLSTLNNLLENREMSLEDGRFLTNPTRFDEIMKDHGQHALEERWKKDVRLVRVSDQFRVICLGIPVPEFDGNPLDPPFRSRFQSIDVKHDEDRIQEGEVNLGMKIWHAKLLLDSASVISLEGVSTRTLKRASIPSEFDRFVTPLIQLFPAALGRFVVGCIYPIPQLNSTDPTHRNLIMEALERFALLDDEEIPPPPQLAAPQPTSSYDKSRDDEIKVSELHASTPRTIYRENILGPRYTSRFGYRLEEIDLEANTIIRVKFAPKKSNEKVVLLDLPKMAGDNSNKSQSNFVPLPYHEDLLSQMIALYAVSLQNSEIGSNLFTLVGSRGCGKTCLLKRFASILNLPLIFFPLHRDMTSQDLFMRRATLPNGDTVWNPSPLLKACEEGSLLVLDSVESISPATLGTLCSLLTDREASLPDGGRIVNHVDKLRAAGDRLCHPRFKVVSLGRPSSSDGAGKLKQSWISGEVLSCFMPFLWIRPLTEEEERTLVEKLLPHPNRLDDINKLLTVSHYLSKQDEEETRSLSLSTRQLIRISKRLSVSSASNDLIEMIQNACLWRFLPPLAREALDSAMRNCAIAANEEKKSFIPVSVMYDKPVKQENRFVIGELRIDSVVCPILLPKDEHEKSLIPDTYFIENPRQSKILKGLLHDYMLGSHLLLVGNQGTGKNKLIDRLLHLLKLPREYIQLDRDTTVNALTSQPIVEDGVVRYEDSALVKAARHGRILVIDEADKAPTHVTAILKSLLTDGEMLLSDGRRLVSSSSYTASQSLIPVHSDFRAIVLANRPGYPFLGNDLFRETGDIFAVHVVENPDEESELALLQEYAPNIPKDTLRKLSSAFQDLRGLVNDGKLLYPYSTRELVNAVRHMEKYPRDGLAVTLQNVFDFDRYAVEDRKVISGLFERHGIPVSLNSKYQIKTGDVTPLPDPVLTETWKKPLKGNSQVVPFVIHGMSWRSAGIVDASGRKSSTVYFPLQLVGTKSLFRHEGRAQIFEEELFSFNLPTTEFSGHGVGIIGACMLNDSSLLAAANDAYNSLRLYKIKPGFKEFEIYDIAIPHFNFKDEFIPQVRRPAPSRCAIFSLPMNDLIGLYSHDDQTLFLIDLKLKRFKLVAIDPAVFRSTSSSASVGLYAERARTLISTDLCAEFGVLIIYQQFSKNVLLFDIIGEFRTTLTLPFPVDTFDATSPFSFLIRSTVGNQCYVLKATGASSSPDSSGTSSSTSITVAGSNRTSIVYTKFHLQIIDQLRIDVGDNEEKSGNSLLHGIYSYISPHSLGTNEPKLEAVSAEHRFMRASGTLCQVLEGYSEVFVKDEPTPIYGEALLRSYLRTNLNKTSSESLLANSPFHLRGTSLLVTASVKRKKITSQSSRLISEGYFGFETSGKLEVVDIARNSLRTIKIDLPATNKRQGSALLSERFDPDGVEVHDDADEQQDESDILNNSDESNSAFRQRAPFLFLFQTVEGDLLTLDRTGIGRVLQIEQGRLEKAMESWKSMIGQNSDADKDLDFEDGEEDADEEDENDQDEDDDDEDEDEDEDDENEDDDGEGEEENAEDENGEQSGEKTKSGGKKGKASNKKGKKSKKGGKGGKGGKMRRNGGRPSKGGNSRGGRRRPGQGQGQGQGQGGGGEGGEGAGGDPFSLPEPGQFRSRSLSPKDRKEVEARIEELRRLTRYFPDDQRIRKELEEFEARLQEADDADRLNSEADDLPSIQKRIRTLRERLEKIEKEIQNGQGQGKNTSRLRSEAQQIRELIDQLTEELGEGDGGEGDQNGRNGRGKSGKTQKPVDKLEEDARKQARKIEKEAWNEVVNSLDSHPQDAALYSRYKDAVASEIRELRATLDQMHAKKNERVWLRNRDVGDLDDRKLVDGLTGERNIYKRRGDRPPDPFSFQDHPKRLTFLFDVSSSMSRYSFDGRLERSLECATMAMEAFKGYEHKFAWKFRGHSGSTDDVTFVESGKYPKDDAARLNILRRMNAHSESCASGDNTLEGTKLAIREITKEEGDEYFCILFSDANIEQYSIKPSDLKALLDLDERVNVFIVFIGSMGMQAQRLRAELPQDRVFVTLSTSQIPAVLKRIFLSSVLKE